MESTVRSRSEEIAAGGRVAYFGYGSLVNRATHRTETVDLIPAQLRGWRRYWRPRPDMPGFPAALLTVREEEGAVCEGLLVIDRADNLAAVDAREARYRRIAIPAGHLEIAAALPEDCPAFVYVAEEDIPAHPEPPKILRSYLDAVLQGFLHVHGEEGMRNFIAETHGFGTTIHDDRLQPVYPRSVTLSEEEKAMIEEHLAVLG